MVIAIVLTAYLLIAAFYWHFGTKLWDSEYADKVITARANVLIQVIMLVLCLFWPALIIYVMIPKGSDNG